MTDQTKPCGMCGSDDVRVSQVPNPRARRLGDDKVPMTEQRTCGNPECRSNTGAPRRLGESV